MQPFSFFCWLFVVGGGGFRVGSGSKFNLPLGSGRVGSDNLGHRPGSCFSLSPCRPLIYSAKAQTDWCSVFCASVFRCVCKCLNCQMSFAF